MFSHRLADVKPLMWGYKISREIARRMPHFRGELALLHPSFAPGGPASVIAQVEGPVALDAPWIMYSKEDEHALEAYVRKTGALNFTLFLFFSTLMKVLPPLYSILLSGYGVAFSEFTFSLPRLAPLFRLVRVCVGGGTCTNEPSVLFKLH